MAGKLRALLTVAVVAVWLPLPALGAGSSPAPAPVPAQPPKTPEEQAIDHYNAGLRMRDKAWSLEARAAAAPNEKKRAKLEAKIEKQYRNAIEEFRAATRKNPRLHQAYSGLGYALRRTGRFDAALEAYEQALRLDPEYAEAIEYRAEAYLGLDRLDDAKQAYMRLFRMDREAADQLLGAMKEWVKRRRADPGNLTADAVSQFAGWVAQRDELAGQTSRLSGQPERTW